MALQHLTTGIYLSELCLIGIFGAHQAAGPTVLMVIFFILTVLYHSSINHVLVSVKENIAAVGVEETVPLLAGEEVDLEQANGSSPKAKSAVAGLSWLPTSTSGRLTDLITGYVDRSRSTASSWMNEPSARLDVSDIEYTEDDLKNAYLNPALTSKMPKLWLARDEAGVSSQEKSLNESAGIPTSDEGASFDRDNKVQWAKDDFSQVPIIQEPART